MALVRGGDGGTVGDLLVLVGDVGVEAVVVDSDVVVGVAGGEGHLEVGREEVGDGGVEGVDGDVLEDEGGLGGAEDGPDYENGDEDYEEEDDDAPEDSPEYLPPPVLVVVTHFFRHGDGSRRSG